jgi:glycosyltransferase involved in cell wall biosynthesis
MRRAPDPPLCLAEVARAPTPTARLEPNPDVLTVVLEQGAILLNLRTATSYRLNRAGLAAWQVIGQNPNEEATEGAAAPAPFVDHLTRERLLVESVDDPGAPVEFPVWSTVRRAGEVPLLIKYDEPLHGASAAFSDSEATRGWPDLRNPFPFVTIIVPVRDGERTLRDCLASLLASDYPAERREIVVVDNDSKDRTAEIIREFPVRSAWEARRGASAARNRGIELSQGEILAFTDTDCVVSRSWLRELVRGFESDGVGAVAGEIMAFPPLTGAERYMAKRVPRWQHANLAASRPSIVTASIAFRKAVFRQIGLFDPNLNRAQDTDFGWRFFRGCPLQFRYSPRAIVLHRHRATTGEFFRHQATWGYGGALIGSKYRLPSGMREELRLYRALVTRLLDLGRAAAQYARHGREWGDVEYAYFDLLCHLGRRVGALRWLTIDRHLAPSFGKDRRRQPRAIAVLDQS